jgi:hypothetical protein
MICSISAGGQHEEHLELRRPERDVVNRIVPNRRQKCGMIDFWLVQEGGIWS